MPGLIRKAVEQHGLNLSRSAMVGDSVKDIECGQNAGCARSVLVRTGNGVAAEATLCRSGHLPDHVAPDLLAAVKWITRQVF